MALLGRRRDARRRIAADERREQILEHAVRLFGERPYGEVSTILLAEEAGVARTLIHHYFGTKRGLYIEVVRRMLEETMVQPAEVTSAGSLQERVERGVDWFLDAVATHGRTFVAVSGAEGIGDDPEIARMLAKAEDITARSILEVVGLPGGEPGSRERAMLRAYTALVKGATREWARDGNLTRAEARLLLVESLLTIVGNVLPQLDS
jgi:AcrR family transcriptional regulator